MGSVTHTLSQKFGAAVTTDLPHCPRCSNKTSNGFLMEEDVFCDVQGMEGMWLRYAKCVNCGWQVEMNSWRRIARKGAR